MSAKTCCYCKKSLPLVQFYNHKDAADGKQSRCRKCHNMGHRGRKGEIEAEEAAFAAQAIEIASNCFEFAEPIPVVDPQRVTRTEGPQTWRGIENGYIRECAA